MCNAIKAKCAPVRTALNSALTALTSVECCNIAQAGKSAGTMSTRERRAELTKFRNALNQLRDKHAIDFTITVGTSKQTFRMYATRDNRKALLERIDETIEDLS